MDSDLTALAVKALDFVPEGARIGLGSGHTTEAFIHVLAERVRQGFQVRGVPTSSGTARMAQELGIPLETLDADALLEVTIDGADEVERQTLNLIKGWGGALVRERIVASASRRQIILVTREKMVERLGTRGKLPVEVLPFALPFCRRKLEQVNIPGRVRPVLRMKEGRPLITDNGNFILDCAIQPLNDPETLQSTLRAIPGVVDTGLFLKTASVVLLSEGGVVQELRQPG